MVERHRFYYSTKSQRMAIVNNRTRLDEVWHLSEENIYPDKDWKKIGMSIKSVGEVVTKTSY